MRIVPLTRRTLPVYFVSSGAMPVARVETHPTKRRDPRCDVDGDDAYRPPRINENPEFAPSWRLDEQAIGELQFALIAQCERLRDRFAVLRWVLMISFSNGPQLRHRR